MKKVIILGAGMSSSSLIRYLLKQSETHNWTIGVVDRNEDLARKKINNHPNGIALTFDALNREERWAEIEKSDLVISMLPARFHVEIAKDCIALKKHLITPSYISPEMHELDTEAKEAGIIIMNEIGVDPGIDHMSAMRIIDQIREKGGRIQSFKSYCGGLIAPESDNNPWNYKFTWNPRNVVLAGQGGTARYIDHNQYKYFPYNQVFQRLDTIEVDGEGTFEGYANRDSLSYRAVYGLEDIPTIYRGTLRRPGFSQHWNIFVQLGMTDDSFVMENSDKMTARDYLNAFLPYETAVPVEDKLRAICLKSGVESIERFEWLGLFEHKKPIGLKDATPAQMLEKILVDKLVLEPNDKDMLVMVHQFEYRLNNREFRIHSSMVNIGEDQLYTSMSNTVGLPVGMCAKMILTGDLTDVGVQVPTTPKVYNTILDELTHFGISFEEVEVEEAHH